MKTVSFCTLGCKVNQYESEAMMKLFAKDGYTIKRFDEICDVYVINTCVVTSEAERKSRQMIGRAHKKNPDAVVAVVGCYSQILPEKAESHEGVCVVVGTKDRAKIVELCNMAKAGQEPKVVVENVLKEKCFDPLMIDHYEDRTRAFVKIEEGCTEFCSYCIIPYARGAVRSRSEEDIIKEVSALAKNGYREIVLTGIHIGSYGRDLKNKSLIDAIRAANSVDGICRIRLGSVEPRVLTEDFIKEISTMEKMCDHFHVSLQSGCDATLKRMNRKYTLDEYRHSIALLRKYFENPAITTDIITGFPQESEEDFLQCAKFVEEIAFSEVHVFPFSPRQGTKAYDMDGQIEKKEREKRAHRIIDIASKLNLRYLKAFEGNCAEVLFETKTDSGEYEGHMTNYIKVRVQSDKDLTHKIAKVRLIKADGGYMSAELLDD